MVKIGILNIGGKGSLTTLLATLITHTPIDFFEAQSTHCDILIVNDIPSKGIIISEQISTKVIIANSDDTEVLQFIPQIQAQIITYGLNPKAAITASSHADDIFVICVQRGMTTLQGEPILPREFSVKIPKNVTLSDSIILAAASTALICGANF
ncbi:MAG: hypothetical protein FWE34_08300 [Defluviitaleaceae bacterium]|nr:hypothetical protein [Defluviitaleaceae bacterium]